MKCSCIPPWPPPDDDGDGDDDDDYNGLHLVMMVMVMTVMVMMMMIMMVSTWPGLTLATSHHPFSPDGERHRSQGLVHPEPVLMLFPVEEVPEVGRAGVRPLDDRAW